jgi:hypothetical protein
MKSKILYMAYNLNQLIKGYQKKKYRRAKTQLNAHHSKKIKFTIFQLLGFFGQSFERLDLGAKQILNLFTSHFQRTRQLFYDHVEQIFAKWKPGSKQRLKGTLRIGVFEVSGRYFYVERVQNLFGHYSVSVVNQEK